MNQTKLIGTVATEFTYSHEAFNEKFYCAYIQINRRSNASDLIPALFSERMINTKDSYMGECIAVAGEFRSRNENGKVILYIFVQKYEFVEEMEHYNDVFLEGYICKKPTYRKTPLGREISDVILAVNRKCGKTDYIPCVCWGRNAFYVSRMEVGDCIRFAGRVQSREYTKNEEKKTAYELSVSLLEYVSCYEGAS